ncbi:MAG TPA: carboxypeptidase regulatory-like domain-containing protein [Polyangia bacterium]|nr:carboxypeptidase regulatory-like domain-containing protein [Polyangia bacterium]
MDRLTSRSKPKKQMLAALLAGGLLLPPAAIARAEERAADGPPTRAEFSKLQNDVREQRQLIIQMMQTEQQRYDLLLHLLQGQGGGTPAPGLSAAPPAAAPSSGDGGEKPSARPERTVADHRPASIEGRVTVEGGSAEEIYVYVENVKMPLKSRKTFEIKQEGRQFHPRVAVVQTGTNLVFPNMDAIYHNVFSNSPRNTFDLGTYQAGDKPRSVVVTGPGVVDIFCNLHQKMSAKVLVVPSVLYAKVHPDGTFRIDNVPPGVRRVVAWSPEAKPETQRVAVEGPTQVSFTLQHQEPAAHGNKFGQAYGSYRD